MLYDNDGIGDKDSYNDKTNNVKINDNDNAIDDKTIMLRIKQIYYYNYHQ